MLISVHIPKTAGSSFGKSLEYYYGETLQKDYGDYPINTPVVERNLKALKDCIGNCAKKFVDIQCIYGHYLPLKYLLIGTRSNVKFIAWLRDPVERLASHYYYWQRTYNPQESPPLHRKIIEEKWSIEKFCLSLELRNFYCQFFWGFPISRFNFIGITEHYEADFMFFAKEFLTEKTPLYKVNTNEEMNNKIYITDFKLRQQIESYHEKDMAVYRWAVKKRLGR